MICIELRLVFMLSVLLFSIGEVGKKGGVVVKDLV